MATRNVTTFNGSSQYLSRADEALLSITGDMYFACFVKITNTSTAQMIASKSGATGNTSWALTCAAGFVAAAFAADGTATTPVSGGSLSSGTWAFIEIAHDDANNLIKICVSTTSLGTFTTAAFSGPIYDSTASFYLGAANGATLLGGAMHSVVLMDAIPTDTERAYLFNSGNGRNYWELDNDLKSKCVGFWQLDESSGSRASKVNSLTLTNTGTAGTDTRTVTVTAISNESKTLKAARELVASSYAFQDWVGAASGTAAEASVFLEANDASIADRPNALVMTEEKTHNLRVGKFAYGSLFVDFEAEIGGEDSEETRTIFQNRVGKIAEEMEANGRGGGYLLVRSITEVMPISVCGKTEEGEHYYSCRYRIEYGVE